MSHRTLINGTVYEVGGGKTLIDGVAYSIDKGKTLVDGTAYEVGFGGYEIILDFGTITTTKFYNTNSRTVDIGTELSFDPMEINAFTVNGELYEVNCTKSSDTAYFYHIGPNNELPTEQYPYRPSLSFLSNKWSMIINTFQAETFDFTLGRIA